MRKRDSGPPVYELVLLRAGDLAYDGHVYTLDQLRNIAESIARGWSTVELQDDDKDRPMIGRVLRVYVEHSLLKMEIAIDE